MRPFLFVLLVLLAVWVVLKVIGFLVTGLFWLVVIGVVAVALTAVMGGSRRR